MKKIVGGLTALVLLAVVAAGGIVAYNWFYLDKMVSPAVQITVGEQKIDSERTDWTVPICFGALKREFNWTNTDSKLGEIKTAKATIDVAIPEGYENEITVSSQSSQLFTGNIAEYNDFFFPQNGDYSIEVLLKKPPHDDNEYGSMKFTAAVNVDVPPPKPEIVTSPTSVTQGDTLAIELKNVPDDQKPVIKTDLKATVFMPISQGIFRTYIGIGDACAVGDYPVTVAFDGFEQTLSVTVTKGKFNRQDLQINTSSPAITEANSDAAYKQYREAIRPLYETTDENIYWEGNFVQPVNGRLTSEYGLLRYTNGSNTPRRHAGIDLAADTGTVVIAPAAGKVVFSDYLLNTGNTIVIEHGGGLKSFYFHLSDRAVSLNDTVNQSQQIGKVGTTGYSTGPHLHFEIRIADQNLDPFKFFNGTGGALNTIGN